MDISMVKEAVIAVIDASAMHAHLASEVRNFRNVLSPTNQQKFDQFCRELLRVIDTCLSDLDGCRGSTEKAKEKAMTHFHSVRVLQLPPVWSRLFVSLGMNSVCPLLLQSVNRRVFERRLIDHLASSHPSCSSEAGAAPSVMNAEEENALRYVSGYVALKLMRKYEKEDSPRASQFLETLSGMAVLGNESSFYDYTMAREWICSIDRGGLLHVNDGTYEFFKAVELQTRQLLPEHLKNPSLVKETLIQRIKEDEDVQFQWSMLRVDIDEPTDSDELLQSVITLWVTIRGFSLTACWMEEYKKALQQCTSKRKALRKDLQLQKCYCEKINVE